MVTKALIKEKFPLKQEREISMLLEQVHSGHIEEWIWRRIIDRMYDEKDKEVIANMLNDQLLYRQDNHLLVPIKQIKQVVNLAQGLIDSNQSQLDNS